MSDNEFECPICLCDFNLDLVYLVDGCEHQFCMECAQTHFKQKIKAGGSTSITCPGDGCDTICEQDDILFLMDDEHSMRYFENVKDIMPQILGDEKDMKMVYCPIDNYCVLQNI